MTAGIRLTDLRALAVELAGVGRLAPSLHNAQPWAFQVGPQHVDVLIDRTRLLPVADPAGRQAHLGLGAAAFLLRLKLSTLDHAVRVEEWPVPGEHELRLDGWPQLVLRLGQPTGALPPQLREALPASLAGRRSSGAPAGALTLPPEEDAP